MKTASISQHPVRRHRIVACINRITFRRRKSDLLSRLAGLGITTQSAFIHDSLRAAGTTAGLLRAINTHFTMLTQSNVIDQQLVESFPARLRSAAKIYTSGQHTVASGRVCVMGNATVTAIGSMAHVSATGNALVILEGANASVSQGVRVFAHSGSVVRIVNPTTL